MQFMYGDQRVSLHNVAAFLKERYCRMHPNAIPITIGAIKARWWEREARGGTSLFTRKTIKYQRAKRKGS